MFSAKEREFLHLLAEGAPGTGLEAAEHRFPSAAYRRRLLWTIRQKAQAASEDWSLYARAARNEPRVLAPQGTGGPTDEVLTYTEPLAAVIKRLSGKGPRPSPDPRRKSTWRTPWSER